MKDCFPEVQFGVAVDMLSNRDKVIRECLNYPEVVLAAGFLANEYAKLYPEDLRINIHKDIVVVCSSIIAMLHRANTTPTVSQPNLSPSAN